MKRYIGDILDGVGRFQALEVFLGFAQFVNVFPEGLGQLVDRVFRQVATAEHEHLDGRRLDRFFLVRVGAGRNRVFHVPGVLRLQFREDIVTDGQEAAVGGQCLGDGGGGSAGHDPGAVQGAVLQHVGRAAEGDVLGLEVPGEVQARRGEVGFRFIVDGRTCRGDGEMFAFHVGQGADAGLVRHDDLVRVQVEAGDGLEILVGVALEAVRAVQGLGRVAGNGDGDLGFAVGHHVQVGDAAGRGLARRLDGRHGLVPVVRDGGADGVQGARSGSRREVDLHLLARGGGGSLFVPAAAAGQGADGQGGHHQCAQGAFPQFVHSTKLLSHT